MATLRSTPSRCTMRPRHRIESTCSRHLSNAQTPPPASASCDAKRLPMAPAPIMAILILAPSVNQKLREEQDRLREIRNHEQRQAESEQKRPHLFGELPDRYLGDAADNEHAQAYRRRQQAKSHVQRDDDAEMHGIDAVLRQQGHQN